MALILISHELGSGGREIGQQVAQKLGLPYIDREIVTGVASRLGITEVAASRLDEKADHLVEKIFSFVRYLPNASNEALCEENFVSKTSYHEATQAVLEAVARGHHAVIAGHGANFFLKDRASFLSVFIYASVSTRVERLKSREIINREEAARRIKASDSERSHYIKSLYHANWRDLEYYHLAINTSFVSLERATRLIIQTVG